MPCLEVGAVECANSITDALQADERIGVNNDVRKTSSRSGGSTGVKPAVCLPPVIRRRAVKLGHGVGEDHLIPAGGICARSICCIQTAIERFPSADARTSPIA